MVLFTVLKNVSECVKLFVVFLYVFGRGWVGEWPGRGIFSFLL